MLNPVELIKDLTLKEKIQILSGYDAWYTHKIERLNIPSLKMSDGPNGVRGDGKSGKSSACFPCAISVCLLYTSPSPRDYAASRMPSSA